jgi:hypothetical protein
MSQQSDINAFSGSEVTGEFICELDGAESLYPFFNPED